jgi:hypothetical protein
MSANQKSTPPPAYGTLPTSEAATNIFLDRIQATVEAEHTIPRKELAETKRMRNFLLYCLAIDYRFPCALAMSASDREHFLAMSRVLATLTAIRESVHIKADARRKLAPYLWRYLHAPCASLGIPVESAVIVIARYSKFCNVVGLYKGCVHGTLYTYGPNRLATKLSVDRSILVPHLVTSEQMRLELTERIHETARPSFTSIDGRSSAIFHAGPDSNAPFDEEAGISYELTARGKFYEANREHAFHTIRHAVRPLVERALACVRFARRQHQVFPQTAADGVVCDHTCRGPGPTPQEPTKESPMWAKPPRWRDGESVHLPELFEHRPGQGHCDS